MTRPIIFILITLFFAGCGKSDKSSVAEIDPEENAPAPYDTTAVDSLTPGASLVLQKRIGATKADSVNKAKQKAETQKKADEAKAKATDTRKTETKPQTK